MIDFLDLIYLFFDSLRPVGEEYTVEGEVNIGTLVIDFPPLNGLPLEITFLPGIETGEAQIVVLGTSDSGAFCQKTSVVTVVP